MAELIKTKSGDLKLQANRLTATNSVAVSLWCGGVLVKEHDALQHEVTFEAINVPTGLGIKRAQEGDWILQRPTGDFVVVKPDKFDDIFELVVDG